MEMLFGKVKIQEHVFSIEALNSVWEMQQTI